MNPLSAVEPWDLVAEGYAAEAPMLMEAFSAKALDLVLPAPNARIVDVAAGSGALSLLAAPRVATVEALDFSEKMLAELRARASARGLANIHARQGDGQAMPYEDGSFDAGFSMFGLMFFPDRPRGFAELRRVLRSGAPAVVSTWASIEESPLMTLVFAALEAADPGRPTPPRDLLALDTVDRLAAAFTDAGFTSVEVHPHEASLEITSAEEMWASLAKSNAPLVMLRRRIGEDAWGDQSARAIRFLETELGTGPKRLATKALLGVGRA